MKSLMKWDYHENENEILTCLYVWYEKEWNNYLFEITKIPYSFNDLKKKKLKDTLHILLLRFLLDQIWIWSNAFNPPQLNGDGKVFQ